MTTRLLRAFHKHVLAALCSTAMLHQSALADYLSLHDARVLKGEALKQDAKTVTFRYQIAGIWTTSTFRRADIEMLHIEEGDQSDQSAKTAKSADGASAAGPNGGDAAPAAKEAAPSLAGAVAIVQLHGVVGGIADDSVMNTFDADALGACLMRAREGGAVAVVLDIHSPGGMVSEMEAICRAILDWQGRVRIIAYPRDAFSAAAVITLCCKEIVVRPDSRIGAAVIVRGNKSGGMSAVDAKMASPHHALQRQFMAGCGRPYELLQAMTIQETQLWWSAEEGFRTDAPPADAKNWTSVDGSSTVLTMTAEDAVRWKVALGRAASLSGLMRSAGIDESTAVVNISETIQERNKKLERELGGLIEGVNTYFTSLGQMVTAMNNLKGAYQKKDRALASRYKSDVRHCLSKIQKAGRTIRKSDRSILSRRVEVPDEVLKQIEEDAALLGRITRLLSVDTVDEFNEAVDRLNTVLNAWRTLLR